MPQAPKQELSQKYISASNPLSHSRLVEAALERPSRILAGCERHTQLEESCYHVREVLEESIIVFGILLYVLPEALVFDEHHICRQHHERLGRHVLKLLGAAPLLPCPLLLNQELVVVVGEGGWREGPWAVIATSVSVATSESVGT